MRSAVRRRLARRWGRAATPQSLSRSAASSSRSLTPVRCAGGAECWRWASSKSRLALERSRAWAMDSRLCPCMRGTGRGGGLGAVLLRADELLAGAEAAHHLAVDAARVSGGAARSSNGNGPGRDRHLLLKRSAGAATEWAVKALPALRRVEMEVRGTGWRVTL